MQLKKIICAILLVPCLLLVSCDKGYEVRVTNYYTESLDSVIVGNNELVFTNVDFKSTTAYYPLKKGTYGLVFISKSKNKVNSSLTIPKRGSGKRTIQIDAIEQVYVFDDEEK